MFKFMGLIDPQIEEKKMYKIVMDVLHDLGVISLVKWFSIPLALYYLFSGVLVLFRAFSSFKTCSRDF